MDDDRSDIFMALSRIKKTATVTVSLLLLSAAVACDPRGTNEAQMFQPDIQFVPTEPGRVSFSELKTHVLRPNCMGCHRHRDYGSEERFNRNIVPGNPEASPAYQMVVNEEMPPLGRGLQPLSREKRDILYTYILSMSAAPGPAPSPEPTPSPSAQPNLRATYSALKVSLLAQYHCLSCHAGDEAPDLSTKPGLVKNAKSVLYQIEDQWMPMRPPYVTPEVIQDFRSWIASGFPD